MVTGDDMVQQIQSPQKAEVSSQADFESAFHHANLSITKEELCMEQIGESVERGPFQGADGLLQINIERHDSYDHSVNDAAVPADTNDGIGSNKSSATITKDSHGLSLDLSTYAGNPIADPGLTALQDPPQTPDECGRAKGKLSGSQ